VSSTDIQSDSFEDLAMPLFEQLYNFAHWLTRNRDDAEDLVQETYVKALRGFSSFQLGPISGHGCIASYATHS
jgi:RNA polymerase sigma-70 factor, ECF subfamily